MVQSATKLKFDPDTQTGFSSAPGTMQETTSDVTAQNLPHHNRPRDIGAPVIVVGAGPAGMRVVEQLISAGVPRSKVLQFGGEPYTPYNRVKLSSLLAGEVAIADIDQHSQGGKVLLGCTVSSIDCAAKTVVDSHGEIYQYSRLILALGSVPNMPEIPGINLKGVYQFRNLADANDLAARKARTRHTVVLGGGLLGLEAARAMSQMGTRVTVIEWSLTLMVRQLDNRASEILQHKLSVMGIDCLTNEAVTEIMGNDSVASVRLRSGAVLDCDTVIVAAGVKPTIDLAVRAGLAVGRGIRVNETMRTTDPAIYAIGECCEFEGKTYGLVAPGLEQAEIAASSVSSELTGYSSGNKSYKGSVIASNLKVAGVDVCSFGRTGHDEPASQLKQLIFDDADTGVYRKLFLFRGRLVGAIGVGPWPQISRVRQYASDNRHMHPWQRWLFANSGQLWTSTKSQSIATWQSGEIVCQCLGVSKGKLCAAMSSGCTTAASLRTATGASSVCGSCEPLLQELAGDNGPTVREPAARTIAWIGLVCLAFCLLVFVSPPVPFSSSVLDQSSLDWLWRDSIYKQITGFSLLIVSILLATLSIRKRAANFTSGDFRWWRLAHIGSAFVVIALLLAHTGLRTGNNLNLILMTVFTALIAVGSVAAFTMGVQHRLSAPLARTIKTQSLLWHVLLLIPLPAVLGFHVLKTYWF